MSVIINMSYKIDLKMRCTKRLNNEITKERQKWISNKHLAVQIRKYGIDTCIVWGAKKKKVTQKIWLIYLRHYWVQYFVIQIGNYCYSIH